MMQQIFSQVFGFSCGVQTYQSPVPAKVEYSRSAASLQLGLATGQWMRTLRLRKLEKMLFRLTPRALLLDVLY